MTNSRPILRYFDDGKGRAELPRLIFIYGSVLFEDRTISFQEYARERDSGELPFDQLPTLEVGDTIIGQSCAIARYAAKEAGLYPSDSVQAAISDMVVDAWRDLLDLLYGCYVDRIVQNDRLIMEMRDVSVIVERLNEYFAVTVPMHFRRFEFLIGSNTGSPFLVGPSLTWADLAVLDILCTLDETAKLWTTPSTWYYIPEPYGPFRPPKELLKPYPKLNALHSIVSKTPSIATWLQTHSY